MRKKMYKAGKTWLFASVALTAFLVAGSSNFINTHADEVSQTESGSVNDLPINGTYSTSDNGQSWKYFVNNAAIKGLYKDSQGQLRYFNFDDGTQVKGKIVNINGDAYYFDSDSGVGHLITKQSNGVYGQDSVNGNTFWVYKPSAGGYARGIQNINGNIQYFDEITGAQLKGGSINLGGVNYYFDAGTGNLTSTVQSAVQNTVQSTTQNVTQNQDDNTQRGLVSVNGQLNYFDPTTGEQAKGKQIYTNGATYYFNDSGVGTYLFTNIENTTKTEASQQNAVNSTDTKDYTNTVDGFLTADTWYRPKYILDNGENWRASNEGEYRPFIMNWWPNKNVEVNYLKFMQNNNLLSSSVQYTLFTDQAILNQGAYQAQIAIEERIKSEGSTDWLNTLLFGGDDSHPSFVKQQFIWNSDSEYPWQGDAWFQGGYLQYGNNALTPSTNSNYRQAGNTFDFLLANDVDNQNPVVQAENLNWLYYLTNFGSITTNGMDDVSNFDSVRIDAVDYIHNDALQRSYDYLREAFNLTKNDATANKHLSLVEGGMEAGTTTDKSDGLIESNFRESAKSALTHGPGKNSSLSGMIDDMDSGVVLADHANNTSDGGVPNYSIIHAHDKEIQENVGAAIGEATGADWTNFTPEQLQKGLDLYYQDQRSTNKKYNNYNLSSIYALMLTNKGTVPRIYYGDMYQDNGQYMQIKSMYYDVINSLLLARKQYVGGGQTMSVDSNGLLKSVRFGKGASSAQDAGDSETRTEGVGVIIGNDPSVKVADGQTVTLDMGAAHKNQAYRPLILTTSDGVQTYDSDENAPVVYTDDNGILTFSNQDINGQADTKIVGTLNPQVSGYLAVWVPVGASADQDARTAASTDENTDGKVLHSNDALDSNVIFEGFSNFQPTPTSHDEMTNVVIAKNAQLFANWGITSFEMAPQYRSSQDHTFLDSTIDNGYAFTDRYDLGFGTATKYGTDEDLRNAIKTLHQNGMQVMADAVMNQLYNLPGKEVVEASRVGVYGNAADLPFDKQLYVVNTIGGGEYQKKYGGEYLDVLKEKYPDLFDAKTYTYGVKNYADNGRGPAYMTYATATREAIPSNQPLKEWSAKYMNGTNILGLGMGYVLKDWNTGTYFKLDNTVSQLPTSLIYTATGWIDNGDSTWSYNDLKTGNRLTGNQVINGQKVYFDNNGIQVKGRFAENPDETWSYYDANTGSRLIGNQTINGQQLYFDENGIQIKGQWINNTDGYRSYYDANSGQLIQSVQLDNQKQLQGWTENPDKTWSYYNKNGQRITGPQIIDNQHLYFNDNGIQVKGSWVGNGDGTWSYYDANSGDRVTGEQTINGQNLYFDDNGVQVKGNWVETANNTWSYYDINSGERLATNQTMDNKHLNFWVQNPDLTWSYYGTNNGQRLTGAQIVDNQHLLFTDNGIQIKGRWVENSDYTWSYYDANTGARLTGQQVINQQHLYFNNDGIQVKGDWVKNSDGTWSYYDANSGDRLTGDQIINQRHYHFNDDGIQARGAWVENSDGTWSYYDAVNGERVTGNQIINNQNLYFDQNGIQVKGNWAENSDHTWSYYSRTSGEKIENTQSNNPTKLNGWIQNPDSTTSYYDSAAGKRLTGLQTIDNKIYYFDTDGIQVKGTWAENQNHTWSYYDQNTGARLTGQQTINNQKLYFDENGVQIKGSWVQNADKTWSYYDVNSGEQTKMQTSQPVGI